MHVLTKTDLAHVSGGATPVPSPAAEPADLMKAPPGAEAPRQPAFLGGKPFPRPHVE